MTEKLPEMGFMEHLAELRKRLINSFVAVFLLMFVTYYYADILFAWLQAPFLVAFENHKLIGTGPAEALTLKITVSFFASIVFASPYLFLQIWYFIAPGLYDEERKMALPFVIFTTLFFVTGVLFCYYCVLPVSFHFFKEEYESVSLVPQIKMSEHLSLTTKVLAGFGLIFEMPILAYFLGRLGIVTYKGMMETGRYAIVAIFIVAAVLTPPDVVSQLLMVAPLLLLYGVSILIVKWIEPRSAPKPTS